MNAMTIHQRFTEKVLNERKSIHEVLLGIIELDKTKAYADLGYPSLFEYLTKGQKYSEGSAQRRISAARLMTEVPEIQPKLQEGNINLTQLSKLSIAIKQEQKETGIKVSTLQKRELVAKLENKNTVETEKVLQAELNFEPQIKEKIIPKDEHVFVTFKFTKAQYEKLQRVKNILSHIDVDGTFTGTIETMCDKTIATQESSKKRQEKANAFKESYTATTAVAESRPKVQYRIYIPKSVRQFVFQRAGYCCEYVSKETGRRCSSQYQLQTDHVLSPKSKNNFS